MFRELTMKILCVFFSAVMLFCLSACGKAEEAPILSQEEIDALNNAYNSALEKSDFAGMNRAMRALGNKDFDYTFCGSWSEYDYSYTDDDGNIQQGMVYMLNLYNAFPKEECARIADNQSIGENDFVVMDYSYFNNPCFQVRNSYKAENSEQINKILDILIEYDNTHDTPWERSKESMDAEWFLHNFSYEAEFETERAMHVDFDNKDEELYK